MNEDRWKRGRSADGLDDDETGGAGRGRPARTAVPRPRRSMSMRELAEDDRRADAAPAAAPEAIGPYRIVGELGTGAFGKVWEGVDGSGVHVAIKTLLRSDERRKEEVKAAFQRVHHLNNTHIATPLLFQEEAGRVFIVMRFAPGETLAKWFAAWLAARPGATASERLACALEVCGQIADALDATHRRGVMHLDVKPDNIMVEDLPGGAVNVRLLDLGLAHRIDPDGNPIHGVGTDEYIAPEIWEGRRRPDGSADQYSLACVLYWMVSGGTPFGGAFDAAWRRLERRFSPDSDEWRRHWSLACEGVGTAVVAKTPAPTCPGLGGARSRALLRALSKDPDARHASCTRMVDAIRRGGSARSWLSLAAVVAILAAGGLGLFAWDWVKSTAIVRMFRSEIDQLRDAAEGGDAEAAFRLGQCYADGSLVDKDPAAAFRWFETGAKGGHAGAMFRAGDCLARGIGAGRNEAAAADWFRRGAAGGSADAAGAWAECLWDGVGVAQRREEAVRVANGVSDRGVPAAQYVAGMGLIEGVGPEQNLQRGASLVRLAADGGLPRAQWAMSRLCAEGRGVPPDEAAAARWARKAAENGVLAARLDMANRSAEGRGVVRDEAEAARWLRLAGEIDPAAAAGARRALDDEDRARRREAEAREAEDRARAADPLFDLKRRADKGEAAAMFELAKRFDEGVGTKKDPAAAVRWWKALAEKEDVGEADRGRREEAWGRYGMHLFEGTGVDRDVPAAVPWLEKFETATEDNSRMNALLGVRTPASLPAEQKPTWVESERQERRGAACLAVARAFERGDGIAQSVRKAETWYDKGYLDSDECLASLLRLMVERPGDFTDWEIGERSALGAQKGNADALYLHGFQLVRTGGLFSKQGFQCLLQAAEAGHLKAQQEVGCCYADGKGVDKDPKKAYGWFLKAAERGNAQAKERLDGLNARPRPEARQPDRPPATKAGQPVQPAPAKKEADDPDELFAQGFRYITGDGVARDPRKAADYFRRAADQGHARATFNLGVCYEQGAGVPKNLTTAASLYKKAADGGEPSAQYNYGIFLLDGRGVPKDKKAAIVWLRKAAAQGHAGAKKVLKELGL